MKRVHFFSIIAALLTAGCVVTDQTPRPSGIPNLSAVEPGVYRGGQPNENGWAYLKGIGVSNVIKLNTQTESSDRGAVSRGMTLYYHPVDTMQQLVDGPNKADFQQAVSEIGKPGTYVHCERGQDRTGLAVGCYRLSKGWTKDQAWQEMTNHGFHPALHGLTEYWKKQ